MDKDLALQVWAAENPMLTDALLFQVLGDQPNSCSIVPIQGDAVVRRYVDGSSVNVYDFALQNLLLVSGTLDDVNTYNMRIQREWAGWIRAQEEAGNYPDFGEKAHDYRLEVLTNMPMLVQRYENGMGKYQFYARLNYREDA